MAEGKPSDSEAFVLRSGVRSGLKREFSFALKSQADLPISLGRTRSGRAAAAAPDVCLSRGGKKAKKFSVGDERQRGSLRDSEVRSYRSAETPMEVQCGAPSELVSVSTAADIYGGSPRTGGDDSITALDGSSVNARILAVSNGESNEKVPDCKPMKMYKRLASKVDSTNPPSPLPIPLDSPEVKTKTLLYNGECMVDFGQLGHESVPEHRNVLESCNYSKAGKVKVEHPSIIILEGCNGSIVDEELTEQSKPLRGSHVSKGDKLVAVNMTRRLTRSALKRLEVAATHTFEKGEQFAETAPVVSPPTESPAVAPDEEVIMNDYKLGHAAVTNVLECRNNSKVEEVQAEQSNLIVLQGCNGSKVEEMTEQSKPLEGCSVSKADKLDTEKTIRRFTRSALKLLEVAATRTVEHDKQSVESMPAVGPPIDIHTVVAETLLDNGEGMVSNNMLEHGPVAEHPSMLESCSGSEVENLHVLQSRPMVLEGYNCSIVDEESMMQSKPTLLEDCIGLKIDKFVSDNTIRMSTQSAFKLTEDATTQTVELGMHFVETTPVCGASFTIQHEENFVEIPVVSDDCGLGLDNGELSESMKAEFKGSVKVEVITECYDDYGMDTSDDISSLEKPTKRIWRSLLKSASEESTRADASTTTSCDSILSDERKGDTDAFNGNVSVTSKKKLELKMSKKITLTKLPANVRDLLGTGLLEGLPVKYISCPGKSVGLQGVIRGNGVLCSCAACQGTKVVSAYQFEIHAGSTKKHPSDFIFLQNGKSLRDVLRSCNGASLDMLEAAIQNAIGPTPPKKLCFCQKCKEFFDSARTGNFALLCDSCLEPSHPQATPASSHLSASLVKLPRKPLSALSSEGTPKCVSSQKKPSYGRLTRKDLGLHKLVFMDDILPQGTEVGYYVRGKRLLEGYIKDSGIFCRCCNSVISPSQFEAHAGQASRRKPYNYIYTSNGVSLHELSVSLSKGRKLSPTENDDLCGICADGGDLLLCDLCPRAFHKECVGLSSVPNGDWFCQYCQNLRLKEKHLAHNDNAIAAGRVAGVDPIEQIISRCIRIVTASDNDAGVCALCRQHDFSRSGFDRRTVIICDQCETEYHVGCLKDHDMADLKELPEGEWFCRPDCSRIHSALHELLRQGPEALEELDANIIRKKHDEKGLSRDALVDVRWRLLCGKNDSAEDKLLLSQAVSLFRESFDPIVDPISGRDLIPFMVYGRNMRDQDFGGVYCMVLTVNSSVISAGLLRVLGCEVAELPLVATKRESQGLGYFQSLFSCIEKLFKSLNVKHFVLPAAKEALSIWTKKFGFAELTSSQLRDYAKGVRPMIFQGTSMLHRPVSGHEQNPALVSS
ncbi:hypothetical protein HPP92_014305 [Vanilla planifolia]|uniref:PHD-type domain-containing protein n=1 Tax=Vanilla planifolia TaxID=51239 RepID=A0A835QL55_VANPL|nr:hypothetical protein HPP92_014305 [Vanilla planifolia]